MKKEDFQQAHQGTGSAENTGKSREDQKNKSTDIPDGQKKDIARQAGLGRDRMTDIEDLGGMSGRDDYAGDDSNGMNDQNTNKATEK